MLSIFWLTNSALYMSPNSGGGGGVAGSQPMSTAHGAQINFGDITPYLKVHKHEIILLFLPKSNPYMPSVNFRKKFRFFSFDFRQNFDVQTFPW
jgi:hypothetical protein